MNELSLSVHTTSAGDCQVTLNAKFPNHADAVKFHEGVARLCQQYSTPEGNWALPKLLSKYSNG